MFCLSVIFHKNEIEFDIFDSNFCSKLGSVKRISCPSYQTLVACVTQIVLKYQQIFPLKTICLSVYDTVDEKLNIWNIETGKLVLAGSTLGKEVAEQYNLKIVVLNQIDAACYGLLKESKTDTFVCFDFVETIDCSIAVNGKINFQHTGLPISPKPSSLKKIYFNKNLGSVGLRNIEKQVFGYVKSDTSISKDFYRLLKSQMVVEAFIKQISPGIQNLLKNGNYGKLIVFSDSLPRQNVTDSLQSYLFNNLPVFLPKLIVTDGKNRYIHLGAVIYSQR